MIYDIKLQIGHEFSHAAFGARQMACVMPLQIAGRQRLIAGLLTLDPHPEERVDRVDFFGNFITEFACFASHDTMTLTLQARVELTAAAAPPPTCDLTLADLDQVLNDSRDMTGQSPLHFVTDSVRVATNPTMTAFAQAAIAPGMTLRDCVLAVGQAIYHHMEFDAEATTVDTTPAEAFETAHGVCQDFSHIMIACLRGLGIPSGYVSGYLRTLPPPGKPRLEGADAMHAWVRAWCGPALGWIEFDPTNNVMPGTDHIVVAYGRDYSDVSPLVGVLRSSGHQTSQQAVDVIPVAD